MPRKILAFAASNSSNSINRQLVEYAASLIDAVEIETLDIHDFEMPIYRADREVEQGIPQFAHDFLGRLAAVDGLLISFAEHNGSYPAAFKNLFDWCSRIGRDVWQGKPMVLLSTSPGAGGAARVLEAAASAAPHFGGEVRATLSVPRFFESFDVAAGKLKDEEIDAQLRAAVGML